MTISILGWSQFLALLHEYAPAGVERRWRASQQRAGVLGNLYDPIMYLNCSLH